MIDSPTHPVTHPSILKGNNSSSTCQAVATYLGLLLKPYVQYYFVVDSQAQLNLMPAIKAQGRSSSWLRDAGFKCSSKTHLPYNQARSIQLIKTSTVTLGIQTLMLNSILFVDAILFSVFSVRFLKKNKYTQNSEQYSVLINMILVSIIGSSMKYDCTSVWGNLKC